MLISLIYNKFEVPEEDFRVLFFPIIYNNVQKEKRDLKNKSLKLFNSYYLPSVLRFFLISS